MVEPLTLSWVPVACWAVPSAGNCRRSGVDFALWGGLVPGSVSDMAEMAARGVVGFKAFMCDSGLPEFRRVDDVTLLDGLR